MKKLFIGVFCFLLGMVLLTGPVQAVTSQNIWITVSIIESASFVVTSGSLSTTNWNISCPFNFATNRNVPTILSNDGKATLGFNLSLVNLGGWNPSSSSANGLNIYVLQAIFNNLGDPATSCSSYANDDVVLDSSTAASCTTFGNVTWPNNGGFVNPADRRQLWLRYISPTSGLVNGGQPFCCRLNITATLK